MYSYLYSHTAIHPGYTGTGSVMIMRGTSNDSQSGRESGRSRIGAANAIKRRKSWKGRNAVAEIVGNLLILAITVVLFSSILYFVSSMPAPTPAAYGDFVGEVDYDPDVPYCNITIIHTGGPVLKNSTTAIYLLTEDSHFVRYITDSDPSIGTEWNLGATWTYNDTTTPGLCDIDSSSYLKVMIVDTEKNGIVWEGVLQDNSATSSRPVIADRYLASQVSADIWVRDSYFTNSQYVAVFVNVLDAGNDMAGGAVYADVSSMGGPAHLPLADTNHDNWWSGYFRVVDDGIGSRTIYIFAADEGGRTATATLTVSMNNNGQSNNGYNGTGSGSPPGNLYFSGLQGLNVFKYDEFMNKNYSAVPTTQFDHDELGVVVVASKFLVNTENANDFYVIDPMTKAIYTQASSPTVKFSHYDYYSGYYVYTAVINIPKLDDNKQYLLQIQLRDSWLPNNNVFFATANISVGNADLPKFETFSDPNYQNKCTDFTSDSKIYVKITTSTSGAPLPNVGLVEICDYFWNMQVKRIPGQEPADLNPVGKIEHEAGSTVYKFVIDLGKSHQDPWIPGKNSYSLRYDMFTTATEKHLMVKMLNITAPKLILDMATGTNAVKGGWAVGSLVNFYKNDNQWVPPDFITPWPGKHATDFGAATFVRLGDINNNGKSDVIAVLDGKYIFMYINNGQWSPRPIDEKGDKGTITAIELGYIDSDNSIDIIVGYSNGKSGYYRNDGVWTYYPIGNAPSGTSKVTAIMACDTRNTAASQGYPSGMDVLVGYESGGVLIWKSTNNLGITWTSQPYTGGTLSFSQKSASSEKSSLSYQVSGTYENTAWGGSGSEVLSEVSGLGVASSLPLPALYPVPEIVVPGTTWERLDWSTVPVEPFISVKLNITYKVGTSYSATSWITWAHDGQSPENLYRIDGSKTEQYQVTIPLSGVTTIQDLKTLDIRLENTATFHKNFDRSIYIYDCHMDVEFTGSYMQMEHEWTFIGIPQSTMNTFDIYASVGDVEGRDSFRFQYKWSNQASFTDFSNPLIVDSTGTLRYSGTIGATPVGATAITIRVIDTDRASLVNSTLIIQQMCINTTSISSDPIGSVTSIRVGDMNGDNYPDMVIGDKSNVWVCLNDKHGNLLGSASKVTLGTSVPNTILTIGVGKFHGPSGGMSIVAGTTAGVYLITQTSSGNYAPRTLLSVTKDWDINSYVGGDACMVVGDVEGDGDTDIVIADGTYLLLFTNDVENGVSVFREAVTIDIAAANINSLYLGKLQNN